MEAPGTSLTTRSHMLLTVRLPGESDEFLVDAGFGGHLLRTPLRLVVGLASNRR
jgi:arylamine N-acetyltransferase